MVFQSGDFKSLTSNAEKHIDFLNVDSPYDENHPYCNIDVCYQRYGYETEDEKGAAK